MDPSSVAQLRAQLPCVPAMADEFLSAPTEGVLATVERARGPFLVLGAAGKMGLHLSMMLRRALDQLGRKDPVIAVSRFQALRAQDDFERRGITTIPSDLADPAALAQLPDVPTVYYLAGVKFGTSSDPELLRRMNIEVPRQVA